MDSTNKYTEMQRRQYDSEADLMKVMNHKQHNANPDYWNVLLLPLKSSPDNWAGKKALDFGCGQGRNLKNMLSLAPLGRVDGCDISKNNAEYANRWLLENGLSPEQFRLYVTNGIELNGIPADEYDFVMSTIVLQHICVYDIRLSLLKEIFRVMKPGGTFSFQMGYGHGHPICVDYYDNNWDATRTNSGHDTRVTDPAQVVGDLKKIGFVNTWTEVMNSFDDTHRQWIYVKAQKP